jgi:hypothetical protein
MSEEKKLLRGEIKWHPGADRFVPIQVELQVVDAQTIFVLRGSAPQQRAHPGEQLGERERLYQIIVRAQFQSFHSIAHTVAGGEKKNGRAHSTAAQFRDHLPTVHAWQHDIDDEKMNFVPRELETGLAVPRKIDSEAGFAGLWPKSGRFSSSITRIRSCRRDVGSYGPMVQAADYHRKQE